jgi:hypothetical protein
MVRVEVLVVVVPFLELFKKGKIRLIQYKSAKKVIFTYLLGEIFPKKLEIFLKSLINFVIK